MSTATELADGSTVARDVYGWVTVTDPHGGMLRTQSVEAALLLNILIELQHANSIASHEAERLRGEGR